MTIDGGRLKLSDLAYIWLGLGFLMFVTSFLFLDWRFPLLNLPYKFDVHLEVADAGMKIKIIE